MGNEGYVHDEVEIGSAVLLAVATVASAWCAYQAALWGGDETRELAIANAAHFQSLKDIGEANAFLVVDVSTFLNYLDHESRGERQAAEFIRAHARPEFRPVLDAWIAERRAGREPKDLPFKPPGYRLATKEAAAASREAAKAATERANLANGHSDLYTLHTVLFAMSLFFLGTASSSRRKGTRRAMLVLGALVLTLSVLSVLRLPRASKAEMRASLRGHSAATSD